MAPAFRPAEASQAIETIGDVRALPAVSRGQKHRRIDRLLGICAIVVRVERKETHELTFSINERPDFVTQANSVKTCPSRSHFGLDKLPMQALVSVYLRPLQFLDLAKGGKSSFCVLFRKTQKIVLKNRIIEIK